MTKKTQSIPTNHHLPILQYKPSAMSNSDKLELLDVGFLRRDNNGNLVISKEGKYARDMTTKAYAAARRAVSLVYRHTVSMLQVSASIRDDLKRLGWTTIDSNGNTILSKRCYTYYVACAPIAK